MTVTARRRRRLLWAAGVGVAALAGVLVWLLAPNEKGGLSTPTQTGPVQRVPRFRQVPVTSQRRAAVDATFEKFVPLAMGRRDPVEARAYVTPNLRSQATLADWRSGTIPVPPFVAKAPYSGWTSIYSYPKVMAVELTLQPKLPSDPVTSFSVDLKLAKGKWLVDGIYQLGTHGGVAAPKQKASAPAPSGEESRKVDNGLKGRLGFVWILVPLGLLSLIVIVPLAAFTRQWWSDRRVKRRYRGELSRELPPLPRPGGPERGRD
jgi:hypothetical protein